MASLLSCCQPSCTGCLDGSGNPVVYPNAFTVTIAATAAACDVDAVDLPGTGDNLRYVPTGGTINGTWCFSFVGCSGNYMTYRTTIPRPIGVAYGSATVPCTNTTFGSASVIGALELSIARTNAGWLGGHGFDGSLPPWNINISIRGVGSPILYFGGFETSAFNACEFGALVTTNICAAQTLPNLITSQINTTYPATGAASSRNEYWISGSPGNQSLYYPLWVGGTATITPSNCSPCTVCANLPSFLTVTLPNTSSWNFSGGTSCSPSVASFVLNKSTYTASNCDCSYGDDDTVCVGGKTCQVLIRHDPAPGSVPVWIVYFRPVGVGGITPADYGYGFGSSIHSSTCDVYGYYPLRDVGQVGLTPPASVVVS